VLSLVSVQCFCIVCVVHRRRNSVVLLHCLCRPQTPQFGCVLALFVSSTDAVIRLCSCIVCETMQEHNRIAASVDDTNNAKTQPNYGVRGLHEQCKSTTELRRLWTTQTMQKHNRITASVDNTNNAKTQPNYGVCGRHKQ
jgi:hypothetical protein